MLRVFLGIVEQLRELVLLVRSANFAVRSIARNFHPLERYIFVWNIGDWKKDETVNLTIII